MPAGNPPQLAAKNFGHRTCNWMSGSVVPAIALTPCIARSVCVGSFDLMLKDLKAGGEAARGVLQDLFPNAIRLRQDPSGRHLWAEVSEEGMVGLLYDSP